MFCSENRLLFCENTELKNEKLNEYGLQEKDFIDFRLSIWAYEFCSENGLLFYENRELKNEKRNEYAIHTFFNGNGNCCPFTPQHKTGKKNQINYVKEFIL